MWMIFMYFINHYIIYLKSINIILKYNLRLNKFKVEMKKLSQWIYLPFILHYDIIMMKDKIGFIVSKNKIKINYD